MENYCYGPINHLKIWNSASTPVFYLIFLGKNSAGRKSFRRLVIMEDYTNFKLKSLIRYGVKSLLVLLWFLTLNLLDLLQGGCNRSGHSNMPQRQAQGQKWIALPSWGPTPLPYPCLEFWFLTPIYIYISNEAGEIPHVNRISSIDIYIYIYKASQLG